MEKKEIDYSLRITQTNGAVYEWHYSKLPFRNYFFSNVYAVECVDKRGKLHKRSFPLSNISMIDEFGRKPEILILGGE